MPISRRDFLKMAGVGVGAVAAPAPPKSVGAPPVEADQTPSMLYDASLCVGCRACQTACKRRSGLPNETDPQNLYEMPRELSADTWTIIQLYQGQEGESFVKHQCMHCIDPACVSVCPVGALIKTEEGPVVYRDNRCFGCRYCMAACPFYIPKSQWDKALPLIQKCDFCADRLAEGQLPACANACPTGAIQFGKRKDMLATARVRLKEGPSYVQHIYGETEAGGTSMLYIARVPFDKLGFQNVPPRNYPEITWPYLLSVPVVIGVMASLCTGIYFYTHRKKDSKSGEEG